MTKIASNTKYTPSQYLNGRPRSTHFRAAQLAAKKYTVNAKTGKVYNAAGEEIGSGTAEPRVTIHLSGKKYGTRLNKLIGLVGFGPEALRKGVSVRHKDGNLWNNKLSNLELVYSTEAARTLRRRLRESA